MPASRNQVPARAVSIALPAYLVSAIDHYLDTDWSDGRDPSKFGALNAVSYIGEQVAAIRASRRRLKRARRKA